MVLGVATNGLDPGLEEALLLAVVLHLVDPLLLLEKAPNVVAVGQPLEFDHGGVVGLCRDGQARVKRGSSPRCTRTRLISSRASMAETAKTGEVTACGTNRSRKAAKINL